VHQPPKTDLKAPKTIPRTVPITANSLLCQHLRNSTHDLRSTPFPTGRHLYGIQITLAFCNHFANCVLSRLPKLRKPLKSNGVAHFGLDFGSLPAPLQFR